MNSRWFNISVFALWLTAMSWLVVVKILPSLVVGDPPDRRATLAAQAEDELVAYEVRWQEQPVGDALIRADRMASGATLIDGRIHFDHLPVRRLLPGKLLELLGLDRSVPEAIALDAKNQVLFHANGQVQRFDSTVALAPDVSTIRVEGFVAGDILILSIRSAARHL